MYKFKKNGCNLNLKALQRRDAMALGEFFTQLDEKSRKRFGPHPLNKAYARHLCDSLLSDTAHRYIVQDAQEVIAYFILEHKMSEHEQGRYAKQAIKLEPKQDLLFAPCIAAEWQNQGIASIVMEKLIELYKGKVKSFVLLGGTQESNVRAIAFYKKWGFVKHGGYYSDIYNMDMRLVL